ncbi:MAG: DUF3606 domain-containing protein [Ferruginibacter sp.]
MAESINNNEIHEEDRISLMEEYEVKDWSEKLGVTATELKKAVIEVGNKAKNVKAFLSKQIS